MTAPSANLLRQMRQLFVNQQCERLTDRQLLERFAAERDEAMFALLVRRHGPMVLSVCRRVLGHEQDAEDAFQAVFLILARKAGSIRQSDIGGFLYRVADRVSVRARALAARRKQREKQSAARSAEQDESEMTWREVRAIIDEELQRLPDALRAAVVLCCLEGKTQADAAQLLGWSKGTLRRRLEQGRERLRERLLARGLAPLAALTASLLAESDAAAVPVALARATIRLSARSETAPAVVEALASAGSAMLNLGKAKLTAAILLTASALTSAGVWACREPAASPTPPANPPAAQSADKSNEKYLKIKPMETVQIHGRVLAPDGQPRAGAKLLWLPEDKEMVPLGVSDADGRFTVAIPKKKAEKYRIDYLIVQSEGEGIDFLNARHLTPEKPVELRLVKDHPIRGRLVNTEGKPVAGVRVSVHYLMVYANHSLDSFFIAWMKRRQNVMPESARTFWNKESALSATTTDADGRFVLRGVGAERIVKLNLHGSGIADDERCIVNRAGFDPKPYNKASRENIPFLGSYPNRIVLSPPDLTVVAEAEKIIRGTVTAEDTGKGLAGVTVYLPLSGDELLPLLLQAKTDARGHYEIRGARKANRYLLQIHKNPATGYLGTQTVAESGVGYEPLTANMTLKKGAIVTGKIIDRSTGRFVPGYVSAAVLKGNPFVQVDPKVKHRVRVWGEDAETGADGVFRAIVPPGPVLLMGTADLGRLPGGEAEYRGFKESLPDSEYSQFFGKGREGENHYLDLKGDSSRLEGHGCKVLDIKPGTAIVHQDLFLERHHALTVKIQDAGGRPLSRVWATGLRAKGWSDPVRLNGDSCPAYAVEASKPRRMVFYERARKLAGMLILKGDEKSPVVAKLGPTGAIEGRLLDADGKPLAGVAVEVRYREDAAQAIHKLVHEAKQAVSDANGAFALDELLPNLEFALTLHRGKQRFELAGKRATSSIQVKPGERRDLGAIEGKPLARTKWKK